MQFRQTSVSVCHPNVQQLVKLVLAVCFETFVGFYEMKAEKAGVIADLRLNGKLVNLLHPCMRITPLPD